MVMKALHVGCIVLRWTSFSTAGSLGPSVYLVVTYNLVGVKDLDFEEEIIIYLEMIW